MFKRVIMSYKYIFGNDTNIPRNVACIGYFDGVHKGHQELIKKTIEIANKKGLEPFVITFDPSPSKVIHKNDYKELTTLNEKIKLFKKFGIKGVIIIPFDEKLMKLSIDEFKTKVFDKLNTDTLVCGFDFTYAYKGEGNYNTLKRQGINVVRVPEYKYYGKKVSSTRIKEELNKGNYLLVNKLLGYEYK